MAAMSADVEESNHISSTSKAITINWKTPTSDLKIDEFVVKYKETQGNNNKFNSKKTESNSITIDNLKSNCEYEIKTFASEDGEEKLMFKTKIATKSSVAQALIETAVKESEKPTIYRLKPVNTKVLANGVRSCEMLSEYDCALEEEKTIMFIGATGAGKSTVIDAMLNYIAAVSYGDEYRLKLIQLTKDEETKQGTQSTSQTDGITCYRIPKKDGFAIDFALNIIDTPGFADTRGEKHDKRVPELIQHLFEKQIETIDAICIVVPLSATRLTKEQQYIFENVLKIFGKDIHNNIFPFLTFDDGGTTHVLGALKEAHVPYKEKEVFRFNNSDLFQYPSSDTQWKSRNDGFEQFFNVLNKVESQSLVWTKQVLKDRENIKARLMFIQEEIRVEVQIVNGIKTEKDQLKRHEADIAANKNFEIKVPVSVKIRENIDRTALLCISCEKTCHKNCSVLGKVLIYTCKVMSWGGSCSACQCGVSKHGLRNYIYTYTNQTETRTLDDVLARYNLSRDSANIHEALLTKEKTNLKNSLEKLERMFDRVKVDIESLQEKALQRDVGGLDTYIEDLINHEGQTREQGFEQRIKIMQQMKENIKQNVKLVNIIDTLDDIL